MKKKIPDFEAMAMATKYLQTKQEPVKVLAMGFAAGLVICLTMTVITVLIQGVFLILTGLLFGVSSS